MRLPEVEALFGRDGALAGAWPGFEPRPGQQAMAARIARALEGDERLLVEAGTGTGKTLAYLVPAILSGRKVVVSTGTRTLQDQIATIDLPRLAGALDVRFSFAVMKGLSNYVCLRRLDEAARQLTIAGTGDAELARVLAFAQESAGGDRAELSSLPEDAPIWREVLSSPETRLGGRCPHYERCFATRMRRRAAEAQIVVVNHHLFFADLALRARWPEAQVIPPYDAVIFDEAHQIEEVATEFFGRHVSTQRIAALARDVARAPVLARERVRAAALGRRLGQAADALAAAIRARIAGRGGDELRAAMPDDLWTGAAGPAAPLAPLEAYHQLDTVLEEAAALLGRAAEGKRDPAPRPGEASQVVGADAAVALEGLGRRAAAVREDLGRLVQGGRRGDVAWLQITPRGVGLRSSPVHVAPRLAEAWDTHQGALIFTSATLAAGGELAYARSSLGLDDTADEAVFPSPFRYDRQALLYVAPDLPDPTQDGYPRAAAERLLELVRLSRGRALLLFTSFRALHVAAGVLRAAGEFPLLVQGERPRHLLLAELRARVGSVLLATQSFWEGVDVPGEALSLVAIDRLPFAVPEDPLVAARIAHLRDAGADPFAAYQIPRAALALKQGFGRLVRTRADRGVVAILDGRIARKGYGARLLAGLPPECPRTEELDDVARFFARPGLADGSGADASIRAAADAGSPA